MRVEIEKEDLLNASLTIQSAISTRTTLPILANVLVETQSSGLTLTATDLDIGICATVCANVLDEGSLTIPARKFGEIIKALPPGKVLLAARKNNSFTIESGQSVCRLLGIPKEEFPKIPELENAAEVRMNASRLKELVALTSIAMSHDETRYVLNGILLELRGKELRLVATDGRRMALVREELEKPFKDSKRVIIPVKAVNELSRMLGECETVGIRFAEGQIGFWSENTSIVARLVDGEFPDYEKVVPPEAKQKVTVNTENFLSAVRRASVFTTPDSQSVRIEVRSDRLILLKNTPSLGELREEIAAEYAGGEFSIGFNPGYLIDVLKNIKDETLELELVASDKPGVIRLEDRYVYIVLPMQLS
ncbi:MAG: DNA polymerase III subunit beta [Candidatus Omnitrophica bacterium]|nr:DNA polymerase III subunit beta [Candidatus Omnitrophota bacterium]